MWHQWLPAGHQPVQPTGSGSLQKEYVRLTGKTGIRRSDQSDQGQVITSFYLSYGKKSCLSATFFI